MRPSLLNIAWSCVITWLGLARSEASVCHTLMDGAFSDEAVWDCGCDPITCDTLVIQHALTANALLVLSNDLVHVVPGGSFTSAFQVSMFAGLLNDGVVDVFRFYQPQFASTLVNNGTLIAEEAMLWGDSVLNRGSLHATALLRTQLFTTVVNEGRMDGHFLQAYVLYNYDTLSFDTASLGAVQVNMGYAEFRIAINESGIWINDESGILVSDSLIILSSLDNYGLVIANDLLQFGNDTLSGAELDDFTTAARIQCGNLKNYGHIQGFGDICVQDSSINYPTGLISQFPDICDATLATTQAPFLDVNLGSVIGNVGWCAQTACATGFSDVPGSAQVLEVYPVPAVEEVFVRAPSVGRAGAIQLTGLMGAIQTTGQTRQGDAIRVARDGLAPGAYQLELLDPSGTRLGVARVLFVDR